MMLYRIPSEFERARSSSPLNPFGENTRQNHRLAVQSGESKRLSVHSGGLRFAAFS